MEDNRWTIRSTEWQIKDESSVGRPERRWRDDIVGQHGAVWTRTAKDRGRWRDDIVRQQGAVWTRTAKDRERWRTLAVGYFLQWKDTAWNRIVTIDTNHVKL